MDSRPVLVDTQAAALFAGVQPATIRQWIRRGKIQQHGRDHRRALVDLHEIDRIAPTNSQAA